MPSNVQHAYLDAMDIGVWVLREPASAEAGAACDRPRLKLGPGSSGILLICEANADLAGSLASDINRTLGVAPVWAWPDDDEVALDLGSAIEEHLFTTVAIFGNALALKITEGKLPTRMSSANLLVLPSMQEIQNQADARRALWASFCRSGMLEQG
jgi:DNA polymerase III psi subunit